MLVIDTGNPPPRGDRLDGVVSGVKAWLAGLGNGTALRWTVGPVGPSMPCDSSRIGRSWTTRQIRSPSPGRSLVEALLRGGSPGGNTPSRRERTRILKHSLGRLLDRAEDQFLADRGVDHGRLEPAELLLGPGAEVLGLALFAGLDRTHQAPEPLRAASSVRAARSGRPSIWANSLTMPPSGLGGGPPRGRAHTASASPGSCGSCPRGDNKRPPGCLRPAPLRRRTGSRRSH